MRHWRIYGSRTSEQVSNGLLSKYVKRGGSKAGSMHVQLPNPLHNYRALQKQGPHVPSASYAVVGVAREDGDRRAQGRVFGKGIKGETGAETAARPLEAPARSHDACCPLTPRVPKRTR